jgi:hypothetical protein
MTRAESWTEQRSGLSKRAELEIAGDDTAKGRERSSTRTKQYSGAIDAEAVERRRAG